MPTSRGSPRAFSSRGDPRFIHLARQGRSSETVSSRSTSRALLAKLRNDAAASFSSLSCDNGARPPPVSLLWHYRVKRYTTVGDELNRGQRGKNKTKKKEEEESTSVISSGSRGSDRDNLSRGDYTLLRGLFSPFELLRRRIDRRRRVKCFLREYIKVQGTFSGEALAAYRRICMSTRRYSYSRDTNGPADHRFPDAPFPGSDEPVSIYN